MCDCTFSTFLLIKFNEEKEQTNFQIFSVGTTKLIVVELADTRVPSLAQIQCQLFKLSVILRVSSGYSKICTVQLSGSRECASDGTRSLLLYT